MGSDTISKEFKGRKKKKTIGRTERKQHTLHKLVCCLSIANANRLASRETPPVFLSHTQWSQCLETGRLRDFLVLKSALYMHTHTLPWMKTETSWTLFKALYHCTPPPHTHTFLTLELRIGFRMKPSTRRAEETVSLPWPYLTCNQHLLHSKLLSERKQRRNFQALRQLR